MPFYEYAKPALSHIHQSRDAAAAAADDDDSGMDKIITYSWYVRLRGEHDLAIKSSSSIFAEISPPLAKCCWLGREKNLRIARGVFLFAMMWRYARMVGWLEEKEEEEEGR